MRRDSFPQVLPAGKRQRYPIPMNYRLALPILGLSLMPVLANAEEPGDLTFSLGIASVGLTGEVAYQANENWRLRAMLSGAPNYRSGEELGGISYDTIAKLRGLSLLVDRRIGKSNWRLTFGGFLSESEANGSASGALQIGDNFYPLATLDAAVKFENRFSPIIAIGYDHNLTDHWILSGSLGYIYTGGIDVKLNGSAGILPSDLIKERIDAENDVDEGYPFVEVSVAYRF